MNQMGKVHASLFSGFGAGDLAATWMGWDNAFWCEIDDFCRTVLNYWFPKSIGYGNIKETDFTGWHGKIDILTGGFPCQPFSVAGQRKGADDDRYLWPEMLRAIREIRPTWVIGENLGGIISMVQPGCETEVEHQASLFETADKETLLEQKYVVETVCRSLEQEGYSVQPIVIPACAVEANHRRDRVWFIANRSDTRIEDLQRERKNRIHEPELASNANDINGHLPRFYSSRLSQFQTSKIRINTNPDNERFKEHYFMSEPGKQEFSNWLSYASRRKWCDFPTQSPVCRGNDGLPFDVVCLTIPYTAWRTGSVKGYGNTIVPHVIFEIYKAIEIVEQLA